MAKRQQMYALKDYLEKNRLGDNPLNGDILNDSDTQRVPAWKPIIDGLIVTVLTDDYIPPIILAEEYNTQLHIVDGGSRTAALKMFKYANYRIKNTTENAVISYKKKIKSENGIELVDAEFDIKGKSYDQLPLELQKKFDEYQIETVILEKCDKEKIAMYIKRFNTHSGMNTNQKMFTNVPRFAHRIRMIIQRQFFVNCSVFKDVEKEKGMLERVVTETIMLMFYQDKWIKQGNKIAKFVNDNASEQEFDLLENNLERLENIVTDETKVVFNSRDSFIWLTAFNDFLNNYNLDDEKFGDFLKAFVNELKEESVDGKLFYDVDKTGSTKDKKNITEKLYILNYLMKKFFNVQDNAEKVECESEDNKYDDVEEDDNIEEKTSTFIAQNVILPLKDVRENMEMYKETLSDLKDNHIKCDSNLLDKENELSLLAMVAYSYKADVDLDEWIEEYASKNDSYLFDQAQNYRNMKYELGKWNKRKE